MIKRIGDILFQTTTGDRLAMEHERTSSGYESKNVHLVTVRQYGRFIDSETFDTFTDAVDFANSIANNEHLHDDAVVNVVSIDGWYLSTRQSHAPSRD